LPEEGDFDEKHWNKCLEEKNRLLEEDGARIMETLERETLAVDHRSRTDPGTNIGPKR